MDVQQILSRHLCAVGWPDDQKQRARVTASLALEVYSGVTRDDGSAYLAHPLAVVDILRAEAGVDGSVLLMGLLHDALEISPEAETKIRMELGARLVEDLRSMTPNHRLEQRRATESDRAAHQAKIAALSADCLVVRLADRLHNLRAIHLARPSRRPKFLSNLTSFVLPLAEDRSPESVALGRLHRLLEAELHRVGSVAGVTRP
jgi:(p)ppGpp synthase/HD superfamily hydrolase